MRISSSYSDYYYSQSNPLSYLSNAKLSTGNSDASQNETEAVSFPERKRSVTSGDGNIINLSLSGSMLRYSLQTQESESTDMHEKMEKIKTDMDSIKTADIDRMTADEVKETLANLQADMAFMPPRPDGRTDDIQQADIDSMSEAEMREMLKSIQERAQNAPEMPEGMPPMMGGGMPPMMGSDMIFAKLDDWSNQEKANTQEV